MPQPNQMSSGPKGAGRVPDGTGLSQAEPQEGLGPTGFDPSRVRVVERRGDRGWLALSPRDYPLQIGVTASSEAEARAKLAQSIAAWEATLALRPQPSAVIGYEWHEGTPA